MDNKVLCVIALDGQSSNHVMNRNILQGLLDAGCILTGIVINNYMRQEDADDFCGAVFEKYCCIDGRGFDYGYKFYLKISTAKRAWARDLIHDYREKLSPVMNSRVFSQIVSFASPIHAHYITQCIVKEYGLEQCRITQFWSDPICGNMMDYNGRVPLKRLPLYYTERKCIQQCGDNVFGTEPLYTFQKKLYPRLNTIMRFIDIPSIPREAGDVRETEKQKENSIVIGYFGAYSSNIRDLSPLAHAVESLNQDLQLIICGDGDFKGENFDNSKKIRLFKNRIPYEQAHQMEMEADILVSVGNLKGCQIPGKTLYYAGMQKPILFICDGQYGAEHRDYLRSFERYILCENRLEDIQEALMIAIKEIGERKKYRVPDRMLPKYVATQLMRCL